MCIMVNLWLADGHGQEVLKANSWASCQNECKLEEDRQILRAAFPRQRMTFF